MAVSKEEATIDDLKAQIEKLQKDMSELVSVIGGVGKGAAAKGQERVREKMREAGAAAGELEESAISYVREKPMQSLLFAAGIGLVVGLLSRR